MASAQSPSYPHGQHVYGKKSSREGSMSKSAGMPPPMPKSSSFQRPQQQQNSSQRGVSRPASWSQSAVGFCRSTTEIACATDVEYDTVIFNWKIKNFRPLRLMASDKGLPPEGDVLTSPVFLDNENSAWWLRLYPCEDRDSHRGKVSLFLHTDRAKKGDVYFSFRFAALDSSSREVDDSGGGSSLHKFSQSESIRNYGFYDFIRDEETLQNALFDDTLWVYCEVNIFTNPQTVVQDGGLTSGGADLVGASGTFGRAASGFGNNSAVLRQSSVHGGSMQLV